MPLQIAVSRFRSNDLMGMHEIAPGVVDRACPIGNDRQSILLVRNGPIEMRYSPTYDHYYFSRLPNESWYADYYRSQWMAGNRTTLRRRLVQRLGKYAVAARAIRTRMREILGRQTRIEASTHWDIHRYFLLLRPYLNANSHVLDIGCGTGDFLMPYLKAGAKCFGIEPSESNSQVARWRGLDVLTTSIKDAEDVRRLLRTSNIVFSNHSLEHHWDPNCMMQLCGEEMKDESILSVTVPNADADILLLQHLYLLHLDSYTSRSLESLFRKHGFDVIHREVGAQLRFVGIKRKDRSETVPAPSFDSDASCRRFQAKYLSQISTQPEEPALRATSGRHFGFAYEGARPFRKWSYQLFPEEGAQASRSISGEIREMPDSPALINYQTQNAGECRVLLK